MNTVMNEKERTRLHEIGDFVWALAKQYHRDGRGTPLSREEGDRLKTISSDLHGIAAGNRRYGDPDWTFEPLTREPS